MNLTTWAAFVTGLIFGCNFAFLVLILVDRFRRRKSARAQLAPDAIQSEAAEVRWFDDRLKSDIFGDVRARIMRLAADFSRRVEILNDAARATREILSKLRRDKHDADKWRRMTSLIDNKEAVIEQARQSMQSALMFLAGSDNRHLHLAILAARQADSAIIDLERWTLQTLEAWSARSRPSANGN